MSISLRVFKKVVFIASLLVILSCKKEEQDIGSTGSNRIVIYLDGVRYEPMQREYFSGKDPQIYPGVQLFLTNQYMQTYELESIEAQDFKNTIYNFSSSVMIRPERLATLSFGLISGVVSDGVEMLYQIGVGTYPLRRAEHDPPSAYVFYREELGQHRSYVTEPGSGSLELTRFDEQVVSGKVIGKLIHQSEPDAPHIDVVVEFDYDVKTINKKVFK